MPLLDVSTNEFQRAKILLSEYDCMDRKVRRKDDIDHILQHSFLYVRGKLYCMARNQVLGAGAYARCKQLQDEAGNQFAVKIGKINHNEMNLLNIAGHNLGSFIRTANNLNSLFSSDEFNVNKTYVVMPLFLGQDLCSLLMTQLTIQNSWLPIGRPKQLLIKERLIIALGIAKSIRALHDSPFRIIHRDLKPENIMLNVFEGELISVDIIDLGLAVAYNQTIAPLGYKAEVAGSLSYMAPEVCFYDVSRQYNLNNKKNIYDNYMMRLENARYSIDFGERVRVARLMQGIQEYGALYGERGHVICYSEATDVYSFSGIMDDLGLSALFSTHGLANIYSPWPASRGNMQQVVKKLSNILSTDFGLTLNKVTGEVDVGKEKWENHCMAPEIQEIYVLVKAAITDYNEHFTQQGHRFFGQLHHDRHGVKRGINLLKLLLQCGTLEQCYGVIKQFLMGAGGMRQHSLKTLVAKRLAIVKGQQEEEVIKALRCGQIEIIMGYIKGISNKQKSLFCAKVG